MREIDPVPAQVGQFGCPQAMAVGDEDHCEIPMPSAVALGRMRALGVKFHVLNEPRESLHNPGPQSIDRAPDHEGISYPFNQTTLFASPALELA
jgi:hypothetical protein